MKLFITVVIGVIDENGQIVDYRFAWCTMEIRQPLTSNYGLEISNWIQGERERSLEIARSSVPSVRSAVLLSQSHCVVP